MEKFLFFLGELTSHEVIPLLVMGNNPWKESSQVIEDISKKREKTSQEADKMKDLIKILAKCFVC